MKGHIFNLLEAFIEEVSDDQTLFAIFERCSFDTSKSFVRTENYPDAQLFEMVTHAMAVLDISMDTAQFEFGKWLYPRLIKLLPSEFTNFTHPAYVLKNLDDLHKIELKKLYPDAIPPSFNYQATTPTQGILDYYSHRKMFVLVEGVLQGMADHYQVAITCETQLNWQDNSEQARYILSYDQAVD